MTALSVLGFEGAGLGAAGGAEPARRLALRQRRSGRANPHAADGRQARSPSMIATSSALIPGSDSAWPAVVTIRSVEPGQACVQRVRGVRRADHVVAALHDVPGHVGDPVHVPQHVAVAVEKAAVDEIVVLQPREGERVGRATDSRAPRRDRARRARSPSRPRRGRSGSARPGRRRTAACGRRRSGRGARPPGSSARRPSTAPARSRRRRRRRTSASSARVMVKTPRSTSARTRSGWVWA